MKTREAIVRWRKTETDINSGRRRKTGLLKMMNKMMNRKKIPTRDGFPQRRVGTDGIGKKRYLSFAP